MANWAVIALVGLAGIGMLVLFYRGNRDGTSGDDQQVSPRIQPDYAQDREAARLAHMSAEDLAWGTVTLLRHQATQMWRHVTAACRL